MSRIQSDNKVCFCPDCINIRGKFELTEQEQKELAEVFAECVDGVAFQHSTYGWIVSDGENLIDAFSCEILTADSKIV